MGWWNRVSEFVAHTTAKAGDVEAEFASIESQLNGMIQMGEERASAKTAFGALFGDIAGTDRTITVDRPSLLKVDIVADLAVGSGDTAEVQLLVKGVAQTKKLVVVNVAGAGNTRGTQPGQTIYVELPEAGSYEIKLQGKKNGTTAEVFNTDNTGYTFLVVPDPEP